MRYAVLHCHNPGCSLHVWVPETKLGLQGYCPECGQAMATPPWVPPDALVEGPAIMVEFDRSEQDLAAMRR